jgi:hypothetical protein
MKATQISALASSSIASQLALFSKFLLDERERDRQLTDPVRARIRGLEPSVGDVAFRAPPMDFETISLILGTVGRSGDRAQPPQPQRSGRVRIP